MFDFLKVNIGNKNNSDIAFQGAISLINE